MVTSYPACCRPGKQRPRKGGSSHSPGSTYIPFIYAWTLRFPLRAAGHGHLRWCPDPRNAWERLFNRTSFLNLMYFNMDSFCLKKPCKYECLKESICIIARWYKFTWFYICCSVIFFLILCTQRYWKKSLLPNFTTCKTTLTINNFMYTDEDWFVLINTFWYMIQFTCFNHYKRIVHDLECCYLSVNVRYLRHLAIDIRPFKNLSVL
jgi:hypothetical protein